ncbi:hypothetical protein AgCh_036540 [Apium graveolens]
MDVLLIDDRDQEIIVSLWEDKAFQFLEGLATTKGGVVFVVVTGLLEKKYSGNNIILSSGNPTKTYFNIDYAPLKELMERKKSLSVTTAHPLNAPAKTKFVTTGDKSLPMATIEEILDAELPDGTDVVRFICEATIINISKHNNWYYNTCPKCPKGIRIEGDKYYCEACQKETEDCKQRYMIIVVVKDASGETTFTLFNKEAQRLIGIPIDNIISEIGQDIPPVLNNVVGKTCAFEVKVIIRNQDGQEGYTVARLAKVVISAPAIEEADQTHEAGPSKKAKVN